MSSVPDNRFPDRLVVVAGTYDGVLAGWDTAEHAKNLDNEDIEVKMLRRNDGKYLKLSFAMAAHEGSVRCLDIATAAMTSSPVVPTDLGENEEELDERKSTKSRKRRRKNGDEDTEPNKQAEGVLLPEPGTLLSGGFDETVNVFNLKKHSQAGEIKTPSDLGSPLCCSFAPPSSSSVSSPTHALVGLTSGKIVLYKKRDWSVQHVLAGHDQGVQCLAVHPTGRMALTGGRDGKIILWDLMKGRLAFVHKVPSFGKSRSLKNTVNHIIWSDDGTRYAFCYGTKVTARDVASGEDLLDVELPARVNQLAFIGGPEGMFVAAACDDGGLPVLEVGQLEEQEDSNTRRAIMAIEPVDKVVAGDDRLKCIRSVKGGSGFLVVTANSGGVVSLMDLEGAARMMLTDNEPGDANGSSTGRSESDISGEDSDGDSLDEEDAAVEILESVRVGSGARITGLTAWSYYDENENENVLKQIQEDELKENDDPSSTKIKEVDNGSDDDDIKNDEEENATDKGRSTMEKVGNTEMDAKALEKARKLVGQAKKRQKKKKRKMKKKSID